jgi:hypothetical protein
MDALDRYSADAPYQQVIQDVELSRFAEGVYNENWPGRIKWWCYVTLRVRSFGLCGEV